jgi:hypothetical protein
MQTSGELMPREKDDACVLVARMERSGMRENGAVGTN